MERIHVLGTGAGMVYNYYNTCFLLEHDKKYMLVDTGAGSQILTGNIYVPNDLEIIELS